MARGTEGLFEWEYPHIGLPAHALQLLQGAVHRNELGVISACRKFEQARKLGEGLSNCLNISRILSDRISGLIVLEHRVQNHQQAVSATFLDLET